MITRVNCSLFLLFLSGGFMANVAYCACAENAFYAETDNDNATALIRPSSKFLATYKSALKGSALARRNLAVSYETGYMVSPCREKAVYWYQKAASSGDEIAQKWVDRNKAFSELREGRECIGNHCSLPDSDMAVSLYARNDKGNHFWAPVTINGHTIDGVIDTGASLVSMSAETAKTFGIDFSAGDKSKSLTAGGVKDTRNVVVSTIDVAGIKLHNIEVSVGDSKHPVLIGMAFLNHLNISITPGTLTMRKLP